VGLGRGGIGEVSAQPAAHTAVPLGPGRAPAPAAGPAGRNGALGDVRCPRPLSLPASRPAGKPPGRPAPAENLRAPGRRGRHRPHVAGVGPGGGHVRIGHSL